MTASDNNDPWGSLADSFGLPPARDPEPSGETSPPDTPKPAAASLPAASGPRNPEPARRESRPPAAADWNALATDFGLEPEPAPPPPASSKPATLEPPAAPRSRRDEGQTQQGTTGDREGPSRKSPRDLRTTDAQDELVKKLASGAPLWDDEPTPAPKVQPPAQPRIREQESFTGERDLSDEPEDAEPRNDDVSDTSDGVEEDRPRRRRRGRRGGRGRGRGRREDGGRPVDGDEPFDHAEPDLGDRPAEPSDVVEETSEETEARDEPRRSRNRRGRGRRTRRDSEVEADRRPAREEEESDRLEAREIRSDEDEDSSEPLDPETGELLEAVDTDENGEHRKKRRRRGRRGGRRRSKGRTDAETPSDEDGDGSHDEPTPTGYVAAGSKASKPKVEGGRRRDAEGEKQGDDRRRRRRRGRSGEEKSATRGRGRSAFRTVSSSFSQDDEGLEYLGLDDTAEGEVARAGRRGDAAADDAVTESGLDAVRDVPSWVEAIGIVIAGNLDARAKSPRQDNGRQPRGRSGR